MAPEKISLGNICRGAVEEVFQRELNRVLENIRDPNTPEKTKRKLNLEFTFTPYPDRTGAAVSFHVKTNVAMVEPVGGTIHISAAGGRLSAYPRDPRQDVLFTETDSEKHPAS